MIIRAFTSVNKAAVKRNRSWNLGGTVLAEHRINRGDENAWIWHLQVTDTASALQGLEGLNERLKTEDRNMPRMIVLQNNMTARVDDSLGYLQEVLPVGRQVLERHPQTHFGRTHAKGKPMDPHGTGLCHYFPQLSVPEMAALLNAHSSTRFALAEGQIGKAGSADWQDVTESTDLVVSTTGMDCWRPIWSAQKRDGCAETYVMMDMGSSPKKNATERSAKTSGKLHRFFNEFTQAVETAPDQLRYKKYLKRERIEKLELPNRYKNKTSSPPELVEANDEDDRTHPTEENSVQLQQSKD